jgi:hypothetical protein
MLAPVRKEDVLSLIRDPEESSASPLTTMHPSSLASTTATTITSPFTTLAPVTLSELASRRVTETRSMTSLGI